MKIIGYIAVTLALAVFSTLWNGYVLSVLWFWFIVPPLGASPLPVGYAIGIALTVRYLTFSVKYYERKGKSLNALLAEGVIVGSLVPASFLFFGWVVTLFL